MLSFTILLAELTSESNYQAIKSGLTEFSYFLRILLWSSEGIYESICVGINWSTVMLEKSKRLKICYYWITIVFF